MRQDKALGRNVHPEATPKRAPELPFRHWPCVFQKITHGITQPRCIEVGTSGDKTHRRFKTAVVLSIVQSTTIIEENINVFRKHSTTNLRQHKSTADHQKTKRCTYPKRLQLFTQQRKTMLNLLCIHRRTSHSLAIALR